MNLNELGRRIGKTTAEKGFPRVGNFGQTELIGTKLMLVVTEVAEAMESLRTGGRNVEFGLELADIVIRTLELADSLDVDIDYLVRAKMVQNECRPHMHGGKII